MTDWSPVTSVLVIRAEGGLFYANAVAVKERILELARAPGTEVVVLDMGRVFDLDVETLDAFAELRAALAERGIELRMASVRSGAERMLRRAGLDVPIALTLDAAVGLADVAGHATITGGGTSSRPGEEAGEARA